MNSLSLAHDTEHQVANTGSVYAFVGHKLRELRKARGLTQADVARILAVSPQQYQKYEDGQTKCSLATLVALGDYYGVALNALLPQSDHAMDAQPPAVVKAQQPPAQRPDIPTEADLLARLVGAFVKLQDTEQKTRLVQLVEAIQTSHERKA
jgi:transcriptional regulator with XRE-family HTH domain